MNDEIKYKIRGKQPYSIVYKKEGFGTKSNYTLTYSLVLQFHEKN